MSKGSRPKLEDFAGANDSGDDLNINALDDVNLADESSAGGDSTELAADLGDESGSGRSAADDDLDLDADLDDDSSSGSEGEARTVEGDLLPLREALAARGLNFGEDMDDEAVLGSLMSQVVSIQQERQQWQQQQSQWQQWYHQQELARYQWLQQQQYIAQQNQLAQQQAIAQQRQREYRGVLEYMNKPPEFHDSWLQFITRDEQGNLTLKEGADPQLLQKLHARRQWEEQAQRVLMEKPDEVVREVVFQNPAVQQYFAGIAQQVAGAMVANAMQQHHAIMEYREQQNHAAAQALRETAGWIQDSNGNLTDAGALYMRGVQEAANNPQLRTVEQQHEWAMRYVAPYWELAKQRASQSAATPEESGVAKGNKTRIGLLKRAATSAPGRGGSLSRTERKVPTQDERLNLEQNLMRAAQRAGLLGS